MSKYKILGDFWFDEQYLSDSDVIIQYASTLNGETFEIGIKSNLLKTEKDVEDWFVQNYSSRPVKMVAYVIRQK